MVYFIAQRDDFVKIGYTNGSPAERLNQLQTGNPAKLKLIYTYKSGTLKGEELLHKKFLKYHVRGEWFYLSGEILNWVRTCQSHGMCDLCNYKPGVEFKRCEWVRKGECKGAVWEKE